MDSIKIFDVLNAISDDTSLDLFRLIALTNSSSDLIRAKLQITRKQYYSRIYRFVQCGLVRRENNDYFLTGLGRVLYEAQATIESALVSYWRTKAIDSLKCTKGIPIEEQKRVIETLIKDHGLKNILTN